MHEIVLFSSPDEPDEPDDWRNDYLVNLVNLVIKFKTSDETDFTDILWGQRIARITRNCFVFTPDEPDEPDGWRNDCLVNLVNLVIIFQTFFALLVVSVGKKTVCC